MNSFWEGEEDNINNNNKNKLMKLVFANVSEQKRITNIVMNAASISNSQSLMALVKDSVVDGSEPEPKVKEDKKPDVPIQEPMAMLIDRARRMGIYVDAEDSRAGILLKIKDKLADKPEMSVKSNQTSTEDVTPGAGMLSNMESQVDNYPKVEDNNPKDELKEYNGILRNYRITGEASYTDEEGVESGFLEVGQTYKLPEEIGNGFVTSGSAELVEE